MTSWVGDTIFGIHAVIYSTRIKLRELFEFELASGAISSILNRSLPKFLLPLALKFPHNLFLYIQRKR